MKTHTPKNTAPLEASDVALVVAPVVALGATPHEAPAEASDVGYFTWQDVDTICTPLTCLMILAGFIIGCFFLGRSSLDVGHIVLIIVGICFVMTHFPVFGEEYLSEEAWRRYIDLLKNEHTNTTERVVCCIYAKYIDLIRSCFPSCPA